MYGTSKYMHIVRGTVRSAYIYTNIDIVLQYVWLITTDIMQTSQAELLNPWLMGTVFYALSNSLLQILQRRCSVLL